MSPMLNSGMYSSNSGEWETPQWLFDQLNSTFSFGWDAAASEETSKCGGFFYGPGSPFAEDALAVTWQNCTEPIWLNPPYGREIGKWVQKAYEESQLGATVVVLLPARTDTRWWHSWVKDKALLMFIQGRLKFGGAENSAPFPSVIAIYLPPLVAS